MGDRTGKIGVLRKEAIAGVNRICAAFFDGIEDRFGIQIRLCRGLSPKCVCLVGESNVEGVAVEFAVDSDGGDAEFTTGANDSYGNFAPVGDEYFRKHVLMTSRMTAQDARSAEIVFPRAVAAGARVGIAVRHVGQTGSTNTDLASEARAGDFASCVLVADLQTAGRGRRDRVWEAAAAQHLLTSFRLPIGAAQAPPMMVSVAAAVRQAVASLTPVAVGFKWPNDLLIEEGPRPGKLAGVLAEYVSGTPGAIIVGVGVNIGQIDRDGATSLTAVGATADRDHILSLVLESLASMRENPALALAELRVHSLTLGRSVRVELPGSTSVEGVAVDLGPAGELIVDVDGERRSFSAGDVVHLRSS